MKVRTWKLVALIGTGSCLLQLGGCGAVLAQVFIQNLLGQIVGTALSALITGANTAAGG